MKRYNIVWQQFLGNCSHANCGHTQGMSLTSLPVTLHSHHYMVHFKLQLDIYLVLAIAWCSWRWQLPYEQLHSSGSGEQLHSCGSGAAGWAGLLRSKWKTALQAWQCGDSRPGLDGRSGHSHGIEANLKWICKPFRPPPGAHMELLQHLMGIWWRRERSPPA